MLNRVQFCDAVLLEEPRKVASAAERAVNAWTTSTERRSLSTDEDWREWQANTFSSALLMPEWAVKANFERRMDAEYVVCDPGANRRKLALEIAGEKIFHAAIYAQSLAERFAVSRQAMAIRLLELDLVREVMG